MALSYGSFQPTNCAPPPGYLPFPGRVLPTNSQMYYRQQGSVQAPAAGPSQGCGSSSSYWADTSHDLQTSAQQNWNQRNTVQDFTRRNTVQNGSLEQSLPPSRPVTYGWSQPAVAPVQQYHRMPSLYNSHHTSAEPGHPNASNFYQNPWVMGGSSQQDAYQQPSFNLKSCAGHCRNDPVPYTSAVARGTQSGTGSIQSRPTRPSADERFLRLFAQFSCENSQARVPPVFVNSLSLSQPPVSQPVVSQHPVSQYSFSQLPVSVSQYPVSQLPVSQHPASQHPASQHPASQHPASQLPASQHPASQHPASQHPASQHPASQLPASQHPASQHPASQHPVALSATSRGVTGTSCPSGAAPTSRYRSQCSASHPASQLPASQHPLVPASQLPLVPASQLPLVPASQLPLVPASQLPLALPATSRGVTGTSCPSGAAPTSHYRSRSRFLRQVITEGASSENPSSKSCEAEHISSLAGETVKEKMQDHPENFIGQSPTERREKEVKFEEATLEKLVVCLNISRVDTRQAECHSEGEQSSPQGVQSVTPAVHHPPSTSPHSSTDTARLTEQDDVRKTNATDGDSTVQTVAPQPNTFKKFLNVFMKSNSRKSCSGVGTETGRNVGERQLENAATNSIHEYKKQQNRVLEKQVEQTVLQSNPVLASLLSEENGKEQVSSGSDRFLENTAGGSREKMEAVEESELWTLERDVDIMRNMYNCNSDTTNTSCVSEVKTALQSPQSYQPVADVCGQGLITSLKIKHLQRRNCLHAVSATGGDCLNEGVCQGSKGDHDMSPNNADYIFHKCLVCRQSFADPDELEGHLLEHMEADQPAEEVTGHCNSTQGTLDELDKGVDTSSGLYRQLCHMQGELCKQSCSKKSRKSCTAPRTKLSANKTFPSAATLNASLSKKKKRSLQNSSGEGSLLKESCDANNTVSPEEHSDGIHCGYTKQYVTEEMRTADLEDSSSSKYRDSFFAVCALNIARSGIEMEQMAPNTADPVINRNDASTSLKSHCQSGDPLRYDDKKKTPAEEKVKLRKSKRKHKRESSAGVMEERGLSKALQENAAGKWKDGNTVRGDKKRKIAEKKPVDGSKVLLEHPQELVSKGTVQKRKQHAKKKVGAANKTFEHHRDVLKGPPQQRADESNPSPAAPKKLKRMMSSSLPVPKVKLNICNRAIDPVKIPDTSNTPDSCNGIFSTGATPLDGQSSSVRNYLFEPHHLEQSNTGNESESLQHFGQSATGDNYSESPHQISPSRTVDKYPKSPQPVDQSSAGDKCPKSPCHNSQSSAGDKCPKSPCHNSQSSAGDKCPKSPCHNSQSSAGDKCPKSPCHNSQSSAGDKCPKSPCHNSQSQNSDRYPKSHHHPDHSSHGDKCTRCPHCADQSNTDDKCTNCPHHADQSTGSPRSSKSTHGYSASGHKCSMSPHHVGQSTTGEIHPSKQSHSADQSFTGYTCPSMSLHHVGKSTIGETYSSRQPQRVNQSIVGVKHLKSPHHVGQSTVAETHPSNLCHIVDKSAVGDKCLARPPHCTDCITAGKGCATQHKTSSQLWSKNWKNCKGCEKNAINANSKNLVKSLKNFFARYAEHFQSMTSKQSKQTRIKLKPIHQLQENINSEKDADSTSSSTTTAKNSSEATKCQSSKGCQSLGIRHGSSHASSGDKSNENGSKHSEIDSASQDSTESSRKTVTKAKESMFSESFSLSKESYLSCRTSKDESVEREGVCSESKPSTRMQRDSPAREMLVRERVTCSKRGLASRVLHNSSVMTSKTEIMSKKKENVCSNDTGSKLQHLSSKRKPGSEPLSLQSSQALKEKRKQNEGTFSDPQIQQDTCAPSEVANNLRIFYCVYCQTVFTKQDVFESHGCCLVQANTSKTLTTRKPLVEDDSDDEMTESVKSADAYKASHKPNTASALLGVDSDKMKLEIVEISSEDEQADILEISSDDEETGCARPAGAYKPNKCASWQLAESSDVCKNRTVLSQPRRERKCHLPGGKRKMLTRKKRHQTRDGAAIDRNLKKTARRTSSNVSFSCDQCQQIYLSKGGLLYHWQTVHKSKTS